MANLGQNINNLIMTRPMEHPLFRSFGLGGEVDGAPITRGQIAVECARWLPSVTVKSVQIEKATHEGHFVYNISVEGR